MKSICTIRNRRENEHESCRRYTNTPFCTLLYRPENRRNSKRRIVILSPGVEAALLAPTAMNQQKFYFTLNEDQTVSAKSGIGFYSKTDLGIVKYHFEIGAGTENFQWRTDS